eukprot:Pgem_evm1s13271
MFSYQNKNNNNDNDGKKVAIFWDIENVDVPSGSSSAEICKQLTCKACKISGNGKLTTFIALGSAEKVNKITRSGLQKSGCVFIDCASPKKSAADIYLIVEIWKFTQWNPPPYSIILITGDSDFAPIISVLQHTFHYDVHVILPKCHSEVMNAISNSVFVFED